MEFIHLDDQGNALMVDVRDKAETKWEAMVRGNIFMSPQCLEEVAQGTVAEGDTLGATKAAGIMGAKRTLELTPLYHILNPTKLTVDFTTEKESGEIEAVCTARTMGKTGMEVEALTGVPVALLTVYDMCKTVDKSVEIGDIYLKRKSGGKSGEFHNPRCARSRRRAM